VTTPKHVPAAKFLDSIAIEFGVEFQNSIAASFFFFFFLNTLYSFQYNWRPTCFFVFIHMGTVVNHSENYINSFTIFKKIYYLVDQKSAQVYRTFS
jgi:hypothetical protein